MCLVDLNIDGRAKLDVIFENKILISNIGTLFQNLKKIL